MPYTRRNNKCFAFGISADPLNKQELNIRTCAGHQSSKRDLRGLIVSGVVVVHHFGSNVTFKTNYIYICIYIYI